MQVHKYRRLKIAVLSVAILQVVISRIAMRWPAGALRPIRYHYILKILSLKTKMFSIDKNYLKLRLTDTARIGFFCKIFSYKNPSQSNSYKLKKYKKYANKMQNFFKIKLSVGSRATLLRRISSTCRKKFNIAIVKLLCYNMFDIVKK